MTRQGAALHHRGARGRRALGRGCHWCDLRTARVCAPISTGVVFLLPVLLVSSYWGLWPGLGTSVLAAAAFSFFHIEPTGAFNVADGGNWIALGVFLVAAAVTSTLAHAARERAEEAERRRREADLTTEMARLLLGGSSLEESLRAVGRRITAAYGVDPVSVELRWIDSDERARRSHWWSTASEPAPSSCRGARTAPRSKRSVTVSCRHWKRSSRRRSGARSSRRSSSRPRRCGAATRSRRRSCAPCRMTCARR